MRISCFIVHNNHGELEYWIYGFHAESAENPQERRVFYEIEGCEIEIENEIENEIEIEIEIEVWQFESRLFDSRQKYLAAFAREFHWSLGLTV